MKLGRKVIKNKDDLIKHLGKKAFKPNGRPSMKLSLLNEFRIGICQVKKNSGPVASFLEDARV